ncbi:FecR domain-containing protein [Parabacteroides sp. OttesenSCG-928-K15]|nr:FecR domain-containing protein [Parabacteroides sp. OttesenSCG-928-K15]
MNNIIIRYLQQTASEAEKQQLLAWLEVSEENRKTFSEMRDVWLASGKTPFIASKEEGYERFNNRVDRLEHARRSKQRALFARVAAAVALFLICTSGAYYMGTRKYAQDIKIAEVAMNHFAMGKDSKGSITLPDGTVAWLHAESKLSYPQIFSGKERRVKLEGEGYFIVSQDIKRPFYVETGGMEVKVLGTRFDVKGYEKQTTVETTLLSGKVEVYLPTVGQRLTLKPNQKIQLDRENMSYKVSDVDALNYILWINDKITFTDERLSDILFKMERWYNIEIGCAKGVDLNQRLSFTIRRELKEEIFKAMEFIAPIQCAIEGDKVIVRPKKHTTSPKIVKSL